MDHFVQLYQERAELSEARKRVEQAARTGRIFHLWWHPHNFGAHLRDNLLFLRGILEEVDRRRQRGTIVSLTMAEVAEWARETR